MSRTTRPASRLGLTASEAARHLGVSISTVRRWSDAGHGSSHTRRPVSRSYASEAVWGANGNSSEAAVVTTAAETFARLPRALGDDAEDQAAHADGGQDRTDDVDLPGAGVGDVVDQQVAGPDLDRVALAVVVEICPHARCAAGRYPVCPHR